MENVWKSNKADKRIKENSEILRNKNNKCLFSYLCMYINYINCAVNIGLRGKKSLFYIPVSAVAIFKWIYSHLKNKSGCRRFIWRQCSQIPHNSVNCSIWLDFAFFMKLRQCVLKWWHTGIAFVSLVSFLWLFSLKWKGVSDFKNIC